MKRYRHFWGVLLAVVMLAGSVPAAYAAGPDEEWNDIKITYTPGTPSDTYNNSYTDVTPDAWYYHPVMTLTDGGLLAGYGGGLFGPDDPLTRAQVAIIYTRLVGNNISGDGDILGYASYEDNAVATRAFAAIWLAGRLERRAGSVALTEYETSLAKDIGGLCYDISSSGRFASMWRPVYDNWRASMNSGTSIDFISSLDDLPDWDEVRQWIEENYELMGKVLMVQSGKDEIVETCERAVMIAYNLGMISGTDDAGTFAPYASVTRAQISQMLYNLGWTYEGVLDYSK